MCVCVRFIVTFLFEAVNFIDFSLAPTTVTGQSEAVTSRQWVKKF